MPLCRNKTRRFGLSPEIFDFSTDEGLSPKRLDLFLHNGTQHSYSRTIFYLSLFISTSATQLTEIFPLNFYD